MWKQSIVAVHGLNGNAMMTWTARAENICWLNHPEFLPKYIRNARVLVWGYNANVSSITGATSSNRILQHAQTLVHQLEADRDVRKFWPPNNPVYLPTLHQLSCRLTHL